MNRNNRLLPLTKTFALFLVAACFGLTSRAAGGTPQTSDSNTNEPAEQQTTETAARKQLQRVKDLSSQLSDQEQRSPVAQQLPNRDLPDLLFQDIAAGEQITTEQIEGLSQRIKELLDLQRKLLSNRQAPSTTPPTPPSDATTIPPVAESGDMTAAADVGEPVAADNEITPSSRKILTEPPDQVALADNLFLAGDYEVALGVYTGLSEVSAEDQLWIRYQMASCLRKLNRNDQARSQLRQIVNSQQDEPLVALAQWWLDAMQRKEELVLQISNMERILKTKREK